MDTEPSVVEVPSGTPESLSPEQAARLLDHVTREPKQAYPPRPPDKEPDPVKPDIEGEEPLSVRDAGRALDEAKKTAQDLLKQAGAEIDWRPEVEPQPEQPQESPEQTQQRQATEQYQQAVAEQAYAAGLSALYQKLAGVSNTEYSDIRSADDIHRLERENPQRFEQLKAHVNTVQALQVEAAQLQALQYQRHTQAFKEAAPLHDDYFEQKTGVAKMSKAERQAIQDGAFETLTEAGYSPEEIAQAWHGQAALSLRDYRAQQVLFDAARWRLANEKARNVKRAVPTVQRPGMGHPQPEPEVQRLERKQSLSIREATKLFEARKRASR
jgi:hypothetical protein